MVEAAYKTEFEYREDNDPISGAPKLVAIPKTARAAREGIPYKTIEDLGELFKRGNIREAWRVFRKNDPFDYQIEIADAIIHSCIMGLGWQFVVLMTRQAGKNETSAFIQQYLLLYGWYFGEQVSGVKFAPVHKPQVQASMDRLEGADTLDSGGLAGSAATRKMWTKSDGFKYHIGPARDSNKWTFLSINPTANVASQTAFTLLEGDEAQDINRDKWERDAQPMASFNNATTVFWGVAWTKDCFIYDAIQQSYDMEERLAKSLDIGRPKLVFKIDADQVKLVNENYRKAYENQVARLGEDHIAIQTQYRLNFVDSIGRFYSNEATARMYANNFRMRVGPEKGKIYIFSTDVAGQEEEITELDDFTAGKAKRDSTTLIIGELQKDGTVVPVCLYHWTGEKHTRQRATIKKILKHWNIIGGVCDATGIGEPLAYYLIEEFPRLDIIAYKFKAHGDENKSKLGYLAYNYSSLDIIKIPGQPEGPGNERASELWQELRWQVKNLIREAKKKQQINWYVPENATPRYEGHVPHDDLVTALFLLLHGAFNIKDGQYGVSIPDRRNLI